MSEAKPESHARILDLTEEQDGVVAFTIDAETSSADLIATFAYIQPDSEKIQSYLFSLLQYGVEKKGVLANQRLVVHSLLGKITPNARVERSIVFGPKPTMTDVGSALAAIYGKERTASMMATLTLGLVDKGKFSGFTVRATMNNELATASPEELADEMRRLTEEFHRDDGPTVEEIDPPEHTE